MTDEHALYLPDGDRFVGTELTRGSWHENGQAGGAVLTLLGHVLEDVPALAPMSLSRLTVDLVRPVPVGEPLRVTPTVVREGKKIQVVDLVVTSADTEHVRARALRIRDEDLTGVEGAPPSTTGEDPSRVLPPPEDLLAVDRSPGVPGFLRLGAELRRTVEPVDGVHGVWLRLRAPVVAGEPVRATSRAALPLDMVNLIGVRFDARTVTAINADVSGHLVRLPRGEWIALTGNTHFDPEVGHGVSMAVMSDGDGVFGLTSTSQVLQRLLPG